MRNLTVECGSEDFRIWDKSSQDFGQCFFHLGLQFPIWGLFAIVSSYYIGKRRIVLAHFNDWNTCQTGIIYGRSVIVSLLAILSLFQLMVNFGILNTHHISVTEAAIACVKTAAWFLHLVYVLRLKNGNSFNTRGPRPMLLAWFCSAVLSALELRTRYALSKTWSFSSKSHNSYHHHTRRSNHSDGLQFYAFYSQNKLIETDSESHRRTDDILRDDYLWLWTAAVELTLQGLYLLTVIPGSTHLEQRHYRHRTRINDVVYNAYEGHESNSYTGFDEDDEELPLGTAKENCGFISQLLFLWVTPIMKKGACGFLKSADSLFELPLTISTRNVAYEFQRWTVSRGYTLLRGLHACFGWEFYSVGILKLLSDSMGFCGPILLSGLVGFIETPDKPDKVMWLGYAYVGGLFGTSIIGALANTHFNMLMAEVNLKVRAALITTVYRKSVNMRKTTLDKFNAGEIINFMSTDTDRIVNFCPSFHAFWSLPAQVAIALYLLYLQIGISFLAGVVFAIVLIPINRLIANKIGQLSTQMMKFKDQRVKLMSEILYGIRTLKFHSWESYFYIKVNEIRQSEIKSLKGRKYLDALCVYFWATTPVLVSLLSFGTYVLLGNELTASKVFTSVALFNMLIGPLNALPWVLNGVVEAWVSIKRINKFLQAEETEPKDVFKPLPTMMKDNVALLADGCTFDWGVEGIQIKNLNLRVAKGQFIGIIGNVGSGKSSLLLSLLGELNMSEGSISVPDPSQGIGLVSQEAWIQRGTIRSNICFAPNTNLTRYKSVIESCCLQDDLNSFKWRDDTIVGDNGLSLSGGQKIRLTLARAVYQDFGVYFLDDIFAAVDYKVAKYLYRKCVMGILKNKTRIVCTHHSQFLQEADWILVMDKGFVVAQGPPQVILPEYGESNLEEKYNIKEDETLSSEASTSRRFSLTESYEEIPGRTMSPLMTKSTLSFELTNGGQSESCDLNEERHQEGTIRFHVFNSYYKAVGPFLFWMIILSLALMQASKNLSDIWLAHWISQVSNSSDPSSGNFTPATLSPPVPTFETVFQDMYPSGNDSNFDSDLTENHELDSEDYVDSIGNEHRNWISQSVGGFLPFIDNLDPDVRYYFSIFIIIGLSNSLFTLARAFLFALGGILGALRIHSALLSSILTAKMSFFDITPIGRILNRFSSDVATIDDSLPFISNILLSRLFGLLGTLALTCYALPWILVIIIPLLIICSNIQEYYRHTARQLRRLGSVSLSPVYAHFSETLKGLVVIRAMRAITRFEEINEDHLEASQKCQYSSQAVSQWLSFRLQMVGVVIITTVGMMGILQHHYGTADPGIIGLAISYALTVTNALNDFVTVLTETEKEMVSVERACEYIEDVEEEFQIENSGVERRESNVPYLWPAQGVIQFSGVSLKYRENLPLVLKNVTFETRPSEKIGICGRTGSGKSSLFAALFRMVDHFDGNINIDHYNIKQISLKTLRSKMCIIPQDPLIFSGTLRENLDPRGERNDEDIVRAIEKCQLQGLVRRLGSIDASVGDNGNLLSTGQKQLVCLARAILVNAKILCIDEATANVDLETDKVIQATLRTSFSQTTVITVAHRVNTILHCDRVLVMSLGEVIEFDDPGKLMADSTSHFYQLARGNL